MPRLASTRTPAARQGGNGSKGDRSAAVIALTSAVISRAKLGSALGQSHGGDRKLYQALGYPTNIGFAEMFGRYRRGDFARRIVSAYPDATWGGGVQVYESDDDAETAFEKDWNELDARLGLVRQLRKADRLAGLGNYAVVLLGFSGDLGQPAKGGKLGFVQVYTQEHAEVSAWVTDPKDERFGLPLTYKVNTSAAYDSEATAESGRKALSTTSATVHWSRILHVISDEPGENDSYGTPRLESVWNRLVDLERVMGGSAEAFWRFGFPTLALEMDADAELSATDEADLDDELQEWEHQLKRVLRLQGMKANMLPSGIHDPKTIVECQLQAISAATGIPVRILTGSERAELASSQDRSNWADRVQERREGFAEPMVIKPLVKLLAAAGVLKEPKELKVAWGEQAELAPKDKAEVAEKESRALAAWYSAGGDAVMPLFHFLTRILRWDDEAAQAVVDDAVRIMAEEEAEAKADEEAAAAAAAGDEDPPDDDEDPLDEEDED